MGIQRLVSLNKKSEHAILGFETLQESNSSINQDSYWQTNRFATPNITLSVMPTVSSGHHSHERKIGLHIIVFLICQQF